MSDPDPLLDANNDPPSTDIDAVQNLISSLRASLTSTQTLLESQTTRLTHLGDVETELVTLKDQHAFVVAAKEAVEVQLKEETTRREVAEETVEALRGQVEAARRGVMTLQKQEKDRKRMSTLGALGLGGVGEEEEVLNDLASIQTGKDRSKRQSMLKSHRRISSQSEPDAIYASPSTTATSPAPTATPTMSQQQQPSRPGLREFKLGTAASITGPSTPQPPYTSTSPRPLSSQQDELLSSPKIDPSIMSATTSNPDETHRLRGEISLLQSQLSQAEEAREASENCLKALREFIASSPGGGGTESFDKQLDLTSADLVGIRLPPLPTDKDPDEPPTPPAKEEKKLGGAGWGLGKLWKGQGAAAAVASPRSTAVEPSTPGLLSPGASVRSLPHRSSSPNSVISPLPATQDATEDQVNAVAGSSTPLSSFVSSWTKTVAPGTPAAVTPGMNNSSGDYRPSAARGFSGFWGRKKEDKSKDLPEAPETGSDTATGLEPSPMIKEDEVDERPAVDQEDALDKEVEAGGTTPKQAERNSKELEAVYLDGLGDVDVRDDSTIEPSETTKVEDQEKTA